MIKGAFPVETQFFGMAFGFFRWTGSFENEFQRRVGCRRRRRTQVVATIAKYGFLRGDRSPKRQSQRRHVPRETAMANQRRNDAGDDGRGGRHSTP